MTSGQQRLVLVLPLEPLAVGDSFAVAEWPLHITVLPPFLTERTVDDVAVLIAEVAGTQPELRARAGSAALFGRKHDIPVTLVVENPELTLLHRRLVEAVRPLAARPDEPAFTGPGFRAHITVKGPSRVSKGDELILTQLALVDMAARADAAGRAVLATLPLHRFS
ncbi:hypothetical protein D6T64_14460 [Cryobacterium melibiosiphilum]|uniref:2'-5' RNA ligase family protein n=1 Tax=Cryobacterium melibiosiphilum TaxID=995039 RepID=A0A3A5MBL3_9MICO|nr:2'-5' RNA ligase family protein [Cryobacterium melibiosiphilum]RJT87507.1 hypothetical protein D6T64_14460 [Cryobacterium melibiosiphilum]